MFKLIAGVIILLVVFSVFATDQFPLAKKILKKIIDVGLLFTTNNDKINVELAIYSDEFNVTLDNPISFSASGINLQNFKGDLQVFFKYKVARFLDGEVMKAAIPLTGNVSIDNVKIGSISVQNKKAELKTGEELKSGDNITATLTGFSGSIKIGPDSIRFIGKTESIN